MTSNKELVGKYNFVAEPFCSDFTGHMSLSTLGEMLLNVAEFHASDRGFGIIDINQGAHTWVLSRLALEFDEMPRQTEPFAIHTWVENVYKLFTARNFAIINKEERAIGYARSVWAMIDLETRKPVDLLSVYGGGISDYICDKECPIEGIGKVRINSTEPAREIQMLFSDIDINGHVNSIRHIDHILDLFPLDLYKEKRIKRFEIAYVNESYYGDTLTFYLDDKGCGEYQIEVKKKENGDIICRSKVLFI